MEKPTQGKPRSRTTSMTAAHDMTIRETNRPASQQQQHQPHAAHSQSHGHSRHPSHGGSGSNGPDRLPNDIWTSAISRLQAQVSYNTGMLESHRRQFADLEGAVGRLHQELSSVAGILNEVRSEMRSRPAGPSDRGRHDSGDLEIIGGQLQRLTNRVNEVDGLNMQMDLIKNRLKRLEDPTGVGTPVPSDGRRPPPSSTHPEGSFYDPARQQQQSQPPSARMPPHQSPHIHSQPSHPGLHHLTHAQLHPTSQPPPHTTLPPMRTAGSAASPDLGRPPSFPARPSQDPKSSQGFRQTSESKPLPGDSTPSHPPANAAFRPGEPLPPASTLSGWRPAESFPPSGPTFSNGQRPPMIEPDSHNSQSSGWAAVNANSAVKRPADDRHSPYNSPLSDGSKRPKLAPLMPNMPRSGHSDDSHGSSQAFQPAATSTPFDGHPRSRAPSDGPQQHQQHQAGPPASQHNYRFITSTQQMDGPDAWRPETGGHHSPNGGGRGKGKGRGRGGGRGSRGGRGGATGSPHPEGQEHGAPQEWERHEWNGGPVGPNGHHYNPAHAYSPEAAAAAAARRPDGVHIAGPYDRHIDFPATPNQHGSPQEQFAHGVDGGPGGSGKKTRTKPIRNAEGVLIRKDGRPDMRSVSSANNLRKVHAKKEAERAGEGAEEEDGSRTGTPASAHEGEASHSEEPADHQGHQDRHRELMSRILAPGRQESVEKTAEQFFPKSEKEGEPERDGSAVPVKDEREVDGERRDEGKQDEVMKGIGREEAEAREKDISAPAADVVMREASPVKPSEPPPAAAAQPEQDDRAAPLEDSKPASEDRAAGASAEQATAV